MSDIPILSPTETTQLQYPEAGVPEVVGCQSQVKLTRVYPVTTSNSSSSSVDVSFLRIHGYSFAHTSQDTALVAISALESIPNENLTDEADLARARAARIHIISTTVGSKYAAPVRSARITSNSQTYLDCSTGSVFEIVVDTDIWADQDLAYLWIMDGSLAGVKYKVLTRTAPNKWNIVALSADNVIAQVGECFKFIAYGGPACVHEYPYNQLYNLQPLPYITVPKRTFYTQTLQDGEAFYLPDGIDLTFPVTLTVSGLLENGPRYYIVDIKDSVDVGDPIVANIEETIITVIRQVGGHPPTLASIDGLTEPATATISYYLIETDAPRLAVSASNPQIAVNDHNCPCSTMYAYVVAEAVVDGATQLFFYSFNLTDPSVFGWQQLTFNGENRNAKIAVDKDNNLHIVWESSRCNPGQIMYGMLGPSSRAVMNEVFSSALDKQSYLNIVFGKEGTSDDIDKSDVSLRLASSLVDIGAPIGLDTRDIDEYGQKIAEDMWTSFTKGGIANIVDDGTISVTGNPQTDRFAAFASLIRNEFDELLDSDFSQLSFQVSFDLAVSPLTAITSKTRQELYNDFSSWRSSNFTINSAVHIEYNVYNGSNSNRYTIGDPEYLFEDIIPIVGSYHASDDPYIAEQLRLRHFMLAIVPERVRFLATNIETLAEYTARIGSGTNYSAAVESSAYTGQFKLALVTETAADISDPRSAAQRYHVVKMMGQSLDINESHNYKVAVHYSRLRSENATRRQQDSFDQDLQSFRFSGDIIIAVDDIVQAAETFVPDFDDGYYQFDIGIGCPLIGEYHPRNLRPYDGTLNANMNVTLSYSGIAIGPHSITPDTYLTNFATADRNVSRMYIASRVDEYNSLSAAEEDYFTDEEYLLTLGMKRGKVRLSQIPITFEGRNASPSICLDNCNKLHITWQSNRHENWEVFYTSNLKANLPFRFDTRITKSAGNSIMPSVGVDNRGRRLIAWQDNRLGNYQIFSARSTVFHDCDTGSCQSELFIDEYGSTQPSNYFETYEYLAQNYEYNATTHEYEYDPSFDEYGVESGSLCRLHFKFKNTSQADLFHFVADFFTDAPRTQLFTTADSRMDIGNWWYRRSSSLNDIPMPYNGVTVALDETIDVWYEVAKEDNLVGQIFYVMLTADDGISQIPLEKQQVFYCPSEQMARCSVPCVYTNNTAFTNDVNFRIIFYSDAAYQNQVLSVDSSVDSRRWETGTDPLTTLGASVSSGDTVNLVYNPDFLPRELSKWQNASTQTSLLCNTKYYVRIWSIVSSVYTLLSDQDTAIECVCPDVDSNIWRKDEMSAEWLSSAQGGMDLRVTNTSKHALFPSVSGSQDGKIYIAWQDLRDSALPSIYYAVWDAGMDVLYSSAQGYWDTQLASNGYSKPLALANNLQHLTVFYMDGESIYRRTCSLSRELLSSPSSSSSSATDYLMFPDTLNYTVQDLNGCLGLEVYADDVVDTFHAYADIPISLVDRCSIRFNVDCPPNSYAVRFKNETDTSYCDWITIQPPFGVSSSSSSFANNMQAYFVSNDRFVAQWILSGGSGNKTVKCQVMTLAGRTPDMTLNLIARYKELKYTVSFYKDNERLVPVGSYNGYPVVSTRALFIQEGQVTSIEDDNTRSTTVYMKIVFDDPEYLDSLLSISELDRFGYGNTLTFNAILPAKTISGTLTKQTPTTLGFDFESGTPSIDLETAVLPGTYYGSFELSEADGIDYIDGLSVISVNVPSPCSTSSSSSTACSRTTVEDVQAARAAYIDSIAVDLERFKQNYDRACTFTTIQCATGTEDNNDPFDDDATEPPTISGPVSCESFTWSVPRKGEPCFFLKGGQNRKNWVTYSQVFELDFSDTRIDYLKFTSDSLLDGGILWLIKPNDTITAATSETTCPTTCPDINSRLVTFAVPQQSVVFKDDYLQDVRFLCHQSSDCNCGSAQKAFNIFGSSVGVIEEGNSTNHGQDIKDGGGTFAWLLPYAVGKNDSNLISSSSSGTNGSYQTTFTISVSRSELDRLGFIRSNGVLQFKFAFITSGVGSVNVGFTCGASCET